MLNQARSDEEMLRANRKEMESIEAEADKLGVSSLVVELGGFGGTYPTSQNSDVLTAAVCTKLLRQIH